MLHFAPRCAGLRARRLPPMLASGSRLPLEGHPPAAHACLRQQAPTCGPQAEDAGLKVLPLDALREANAHEGPCASVQAVHVVGDARHVAVLIEPLLVQAVCMVPVVAQDLHMRCSHVSPDTSLPAQKPVQAVCVVPKDAWDLHCRACVKVCRSKNLCWQASGMTLLACYRKIHQFQHSAEGLRHGASKGGTCKHAMHMQPCDAHALGED